MTTVNLVAETKDDRPRHFRSLRERRGTRATGEANGLTKGPEAVDKSLLCADLGDAGRLSDGHRRLGGAL